MESFAEKLERLKEIVNAKAIAYKNQKKLITQNGQDSPFVFNIKKFLSADNPTIKSFSNKLAKVKEIIRAKSLIFRNQEKMVAPNGQDLGFIFDIRKIIN